MRAYLLVLVGGSIGSALRHAVNIAFARWLGTSFPFPTLFGDAVPPAEDATVVEAEVTVATTAAEAKAALVRLAGIETHAV